MSTRYISVDSDVIKAAFQEKKISMRSVAVALGGEPNKISANLCAGRMEEGFFNNVCAILGLNPKDAEMKLPPADVRGGTEQPAAQDQTEKIISYIQDIGKIHTEQLREIRELRRDMKEMLTALNTNLIDCTTELHQTAEAVRNHAVAVNQNMNKMHNLMKYGKT